RLGDGPGVRALGARQPAGADCQRGRCPAPGAPRAGRARRAPGGSGRLNNPRNPGASEPDPPGMRSRCWFGLLALLAMVSPTRAQALQQQTGSFVLSVRGAYRFSETSTEALAELSVSIPLDRVARATGARSPSPRRAPALALAASAAALAQVPAAPQDPSSEAAAQPAPPPAAPRPSPAFELTPSLVRATVAAALRAAGYRKLERRFESLASLARVSASFTDLRL